MGLDIEETKQQSPFPEEVEGTLMYFLRLDQMHHQQSVPQSIRICNLS